MNKSKILRKVNPYDLNSVGNAMDKSVRQEKIKITSLRSAPTLYAGSKASSSSPMFGGKK